MVSVNELGLDLFEELVEISDLLNVAYHELDNGSRIVDCGVSVPGGYGAGEYFTRICMGGLGEVTFRMGEIGSFPMPFIDINTDFPAISCLGAQKAGWTVKEGNYFAMGSGPARALSLKPKHTFEVIEYEDEFDAAVICLESDTLPNGEVMKKIADACKVEVENVAAVVAPTSSMVGSVQVAGRCVETAIYKLNELGFDTKKIISGFGTAPVPPVRGPKLAMGVTNDATIYHGRICLTMNAPEIKDYLDKIPSNTSKGYGKPFNEIFKEANYDFYQIDTSLFSPAEVIINELSEGAVYHVGAVNPEVTLKSFGFI
ncbi:MAG: methenyltetrahydromethanopterin cyclohydrolase [Methanocalculus sp.]|uniref:methenyltetrahydromethanopterin cyclohydrolase n=1 Tax=Methanocalculus sp. TaxID=2004547 RepID=UPI002729176B|nr:methenyltetrahydromethanopterin cyclohydrolase [Methanocalculus sp.]MDO8840959.1 methenyltetrahydromethanopterin cyclohydrolase [Methanocalculus sp.]MDO9539563.1 methenyltetrahydromethanopterin cyclohydrolase [Methanocalculus sp.]